MFILAAIPIDFSKLVNHENITTAIQVIVLAVIGFPVLFFISSIVRKTVNKRFTAQAGMLASKAIFYTGGAFLIVTILYQMGFRLTALLGAAGVVGIAIGFASQTSVSNIISGLFLISEKPFEVGDIIKVDNTVGVVLSIDLLSVKLKQFDNSFVRIPNEMLIKTQVTNSTRFPIRRLDINIGVAYKEDITRVRRVLMAIALKTPYCLDEPEPEVRFMNFGDSALEFIFVIWCVREDYLKLRTTIMQTIKERFDAEGIEIPFPHRTLYTGAITDPFPIRLITDDKK